MPSHQSAEKRNRQSIKRADRNRTVRSTVRTETKKLNEALEGAEKEKSAAQFKQTAKTLNKAASKGVLKKKTASRRISRLAKRVHQVSAAATKA